MCQLHFALRATLNDRLRFESDVKINLLREKKYIYSVYYRLSSQKCMDGKFWCNYVKAHSCQSYLWQWGKETKLERKTEGRWSKRNDKGRTGQRRKEGIGCCVNYSDMFSGKQQTVRVWNEVKGPAAIQSHAGKRKPVSVLFWCHWSGLEITLIVLKLTDITRKHWLTDRKPQIFHFFLSFCSHLYLPWLYP